MGRLMVGFSLLALATLNHQPARAQGASVGDYRSLTETQRFYWVSGYVEGFALAAQIGGRAPALQQCFAEWNVQRVQGIYDKWIEANPDKRSQPWTARVGLFQALAEACGWRRQ